jgi:D-arabinose 1-dehydrogenase-like Zn-dependent alcohol dehydrogenase
VTDPRTSVAAVLTDHSKPTQIRELPVPALAEDAVLVRIEATTMCGTDGQIADGDRARPGLAHLPSVPGHGLIDRAVALGRPLHDGDRSASDRVGLAVATGSVTTVASLTEAVRHHAAPHPAPATAHPGSSS